MTYRKTWYHCVVWFLYTVLCIALLVYAGTVWTYYFAGMPYAEGFPASIASPLAGQSDGMLIALGALTVPGTIALYWLVRRIAGQIRKKCIWKQSVVTGFECVAVLLIMAAGIFLRFDRAGYDIMAAENGLLSSYGQAQGMQYYDMAVVTVEHAMPSFSVIGLGELYVLCLSVLLSFLGNKFAAAIIMQVCLQIIGMILAYAVTRKLAGRIPACAALLCLACSYCCLEMLVCVGPEWFYFDLYLIGLLLVASFAKCYCENRLRVPAAVLLAALLGVIIGLLIWLHPTALTLLIPLVAVAIGKKHRQEEQTVRHGALVSLTVVITVILSAMLCWAGVTAAAYYENGIGIDTVITRCVEHLGQLRYDILTPPSYPYDADIYLMGVLVVFASFLVFDFLRKDKEQNYTLWMLLCILAAPAPLFALGQGGGVQFFGIFSIYVWSVLAGLGLQNCIFGGRAQAMQAVIEEINSAAERRTQEEPTADDGLEQEETSMTEEQLEGPKTDETAAPKKPRFFENPLPLPKKHVKKEMDYQYQVDEKDMKYDIEVDEDDDFDI